MKTPNPSTVNPSTVRDPWTRMTSGLPYHGGDPAPDGAVWPRASAEAAALAERYHREELSGNRDQADALLAELLGSVGENTRIRGPLYVDYGLNLHVGRETFVNFGLTALDVCEIRIGDHVQIGPHVQLLCPTHPLHPVDRARGWEAGLPITLEDNVWLGGGVIVLGGVRIGHDAVIGAGAVVTGDVPANVVAVGNPARVIREL